VPRDKVCLFSVHCRNLTDKLLSLAQSELYIALATVFRRFTFELYETDISDVEMVHAYLVPYPKWETKGVRVKVNSIDA
jgi:hypothetical protein